MSCSASSPPPAGTCGDRPARGAARRAEPPLQRHLVDLHHDPVDLVLDVVPVLAPVGDVAERPVEVVEDLRVGRHRQPPGGELLVRPALRLGLPALAGAETVDVIDSGAVAVTRGSFCRRLPAAALRGLANGALPSAVIRSLTRSKSAVARNTSPRTSSSAGTCAPVSRSGTLRSVATFGVMSSPVRPVAAGGRRTSRPSR
jgi:hypothetical protein